MIVLFFALDGLSLDVVTHGRAVRNPDYINYQAQRLFYGFNGPCNRVQGRRICVNKSVASFPACLVVMDPLPDWLIEYSRFDAIITFNWCTLGLGHVCLLGELSMALKQTSFFIFDTKTFELFYPALS